MNQQANTIDLAEQCHSEPECPQDSLNRAQDLLESENVAIQGFIEMLRRDMDVLEVKINREDALTVASVAYRVKAKAKALGIQTIQRSADQIETCARQNQISQLAAEIDLMRYQVELFVRSYGQESHPARYR